MINWIKRKIEDKKQQDAEAAQLLIKAEAKIRKERKRELIELRLITINNTRYLRSSINVYNGTVNNIKGKSSSETKRKRDFINSKIEWMRLKLEEETLMLSYYDQQISVL